MKFNRKVSVHFTDGQAEIVDNPGTLSYHGSFLVLNECSTAADGTTVTIVRAWPFSRIHQATVVTEQKVDRTPLSDHDRLQEVINHGEVIEALSLELAGQGVDE